MLLYGSQGYVVDVVVDENGDGTCFFASGEYEDGEEVSDEELDYLEGKYVYFLEEEAMERSLETLEWYG